MIKRTDFLAPAIRTLLAIFFFIPNITVHAVDGSEGGRAADQQAMDVAAVPNASMLLHSSGFTQQIAWLPSAIASSFDKLVTQEGVSAPFERDDVPYLKNSVTSTFSAEAIEAAVVNELDNRLTDDDLSYLIQFYESAQGQILRQAELDNSILTNATRFELWYAEAGFYSMPSERQFAVSDLESAMQATVGAVDAMIGMQVAMQVALTPALPPDEQLSPNDLMIDAQRLRPSLTLSYKQSSREALAFIFQQQDLNQLQAYTAVLSSDAGQRFVRATNDGMNRALFTAAQNLGKTIGTLLAGRSGQGV